MDAELKPRVHRGLNPGKTDLTSQSNCLPQVSNGMSAEIQQSLLSVCCAARQTVNTLTLLGARALAVGSGQAKEKT